jgi:hypothetical protein
VKVLRAKHSSGDALPYELRILEYIDSLRAPSSEGLVDDQPLIDALGEAVNAASINGSDYPHTVIEKYQRALLPLLRAALKGGEK